VDRKSYENIDEYIAGFPEDIQSKLQQLRKAIKKAAPQAQETISYGMPAFKLNGVLVYFAAFKNHIGFFPTSSGVEAFKKELTPYAISKGTIRFPLDKPIPFDLVEKVVKFRLNEVSIKKERTSLRRTLSS
jgi:uncharacterized protein YdhG (YjbR/CyaY superfamily)